MVILLGFCLIMASLVLPVGLSYHFERLQTAQAQMIDSISDVTKLLEIPAGAAAFLSFAKLEFNSENILFWLRVRDFRNGNMAGSKQAAAALLSSSQPSASNGQQRNGAATAHSRAVSS